MARAKEEEEDFHRRLRSRPVADVVVCDSFVLEDPRHRRFLKAVEEVEEVLVEVSVDDQLEVAKEEVAAQESHPGIVVGEEAVEVDDHAGDEAEGLPLLRHRVLRNMV